MSLQKFGNIFGLQLRKGLFPYETYNNIDDIRRTIQWPKYTQFYSSLPTKETDYLDEIDDLLNLPMIFGFDNVGQIVDFLNLELDLELNDYNCEKISDLNVETRNELQKRLRLSPKEFLENKFEYERKIESGVYTSFLDHLKFYNGPV